MTDFWLSSGHHLVDRGDDGRLRVTEEFLQAYLARPEVLPPDDACDAERALYQRLRFDARTDVTSAEIARLADRDARENWRLLIAFRDHLLAHPTMEDAYLALARAKKVELPPIFLGQLVHVILRGILDGETDPYILRAGEIFFRAQRLTVSDGVMLLADEERVDGSDVTDHTSPLVAIFGDARARDLDILGPGNADQYMARSDAHDFVVDFRHGSRARAALATVMQRWIAHMLGLDVVIAPRERIESDTWKWFVGLEPEATRIGNAMWQGQEPPEDGRQRIVALFEAEMRDQSRVLERIRGAPVVLILAMTSNRIIRFKPQNLLAGLPLIETSLAGAAR